jgi:serine/threonine-protein kinase
MSGDDDNEMLDPTEPDAGERSGSGSSVPLIERLNRALEERYRIEGELGEGGFATVYVGQDLKHDRRVAIKVLKRAIAETVDRDRFLAEIRTTARLQHPNILPLFDSGQVDGRPFYVMPLVEGGTLDTRIAREKGLPFDEATEIIAEVADALDHAHAQGIVHRDIKPANILLRDGRPLLADFGIAIARESGHRLTETGLALGTLIYMSPEQANGERDVGPATDIYALAAVLYEALVGQPAVSGSTAAAQLTNIVSGSTGSVRTHRRSIPVNVDHAIQKGMAQSPSDRFPSAGAFARALSDAEFRYPSARPPAWSDGSEDVRGNPWWKRATILLTATVALLAIGLLQAVSRRPSPDGVAPVHFTLLPRGEGARFVGAESPGISQDGRLLAFPARVGDTTRIQLRSLDGFDARWVNGTDDGFSPFFSPDGRWLGFFVLGELRKVPLDGGPPTTIATVPFPLGTSAVWLPNDTIIFSYGNARGLQAVHANGGEPWPITFPDTAAGEVFHAEPRALPDGRVLFQIRRSVEDRDRWSDASRTGIVSLRDGTTLRPDLAGAPWGYLAPDRLLVWHSGAFRAYPFDLRTSRVTAPPEPVRTDLRGGDSCDQLRVSASGTAVCADLSAVVSRTLAWVDRSGTPTPLPFPVGAYRWPRVAPDGSAIAGAVGTTSIMSLDVRTNAVVMISSAVSGEPTWTPDSRSIVYWEQDASGTANLWIRDRRGAEPPRQLTNDPVRSDWATSVSPDGSTVLFYDETDLWSVPVDGGEARQLTRTPAWERDGVFSPDGALVAYSSDEQGRREVYVTTWPDMVGRTRVSFEGGRSPQWSRDGRELFYLEGSRIMAAPVTRTPDVEIGAPRELFHGGFWIDPSGDQFYDVAADGRFLMVQGEDVVNLRVVTDLGSAIER